VEQVLDAGISVHDFHGFEAGLRARYFELRRLGRDPVIATRRDKSDDIVTIFRLHASG